MGRDRDRSGAMPGRRPARVADEIQRHLGDILLVRVSDPKLEDVRLTEVKVTGDLRLARVYYTMGGDEAARADAAEGLRRATGFLKRELSSRLILRYMPDLEFHYDESLDHGERVDALLAGLPSVSRVDGDGEEQES